MTFLSNIYFIKALLIFFVTLTGTLLILPKLIHIASTWVVTKEGIHDKSYSLMDHPDNQRKVHDVPKPLIIVHFLYNKVLIFLTKKVFPVNINTKI